MLVISRKKGESLLIGDDIEITVEKIDSSSVKISIKAPKEKVILRKEVYEKVKDENSNAIATTKDILKILKYEDNMYTANPYNIYKQNSVNMASSQQLLLMLLDGAVKYTKIARMAILNKDIAKAHKELVRVQDIFLELMITMDKNTKYMEDLYNIYDFIKNELVKANIKKDITIIDNTLPLIEEIRDMWYEVDAKIKSGK